MAVRVHMAEEKKREGDKRPFKHEKGVHLNLWPDHDERIRWLPRQGDPTCLLEWVSQTAIKAVAWAPLYTALIATLTLLVFIFGVPFIGGK